MSTHKKSGLILILVTLFIDSMGFGIIIPVVPTLLKEMAPGYEPAFLGGLLLATYAIVQFVFGPVFGGLSDRYGRRPILLASLFGFGMDYLITAFAPSIEWLFFARFLAGIMGASFTTGAAYISDVSTPENRSQNFGLIGVAFGLGFIAGPLIGGLLGSVGTRVPFFVTAGLTLLNGLIAFFFLPESLKPENRRNFEWARANPFGTFKSIFKYEIIKKLIVPLSFIYLAAHAVQSNWSFFTVKRFGWDESQIGISLAVVGVMFAIVQGGLIRVIIPKLGQSRSVYLGLGLNALGLLLYAFAYQSWMMYAFTVVYCFGGIAGPALQGIMASTVPPNAQGELQGGFTSIMSLMSIFGPLIMNVLLFTYFTSDAAPIYFPGVAMFLGAVLCLIATIMARGVLKKFVAPVAK
jgi:MFS transporter, DHA1 family, tetracycline resistance protein